MHPELLNLPFLPSIKSYGTMMVLGFLSALFIMRRLGKRVDIDPILMTNAALYSLMAGIVGARVFYVLHHFSQFKENPLDIFAIWKGGLEFLGGVFMAIVYLIWYLRKHRVCVRRVLDIMAIGLMMALAFGRVGCLLNGCCWGKPTDLPWGIRFPYRSFAYLSQVEPDPHRHRDKPYLYLPAEYWYHDPVDNAWVPKPFDMLTPAQQQQVTEGQYRCLSVHPSQPYGTLNALAICGILYVFWHKIINKGGGQRLRIRSPGLTFCLMLILYGIGRFMLELSRDDNPFEVAWLTISQLLGLGLIVLGLVMIPIMIKLGPVQTKPVTEST